MEREETSRSRKERLSKGKKKVLRVRDMFSIWNVVMVSKVYTIFKTCKIMHTV